jgi:hypothetical protein
MYCVYSKIALKHLKKAPTCFDLSIIIREHTYFRAEVCFDLSIIIREHT